MVSIQTLQNWLRPIEINSIDYCEGYDHFCFGLRPQEKDNAEYMLGYDQASQDLINDLFPSLTKE